MKTELIRSVVPVTSWIAEKAPVLIRRPATTGLPVIIQLRSTANKVAAGKPLQLRQWLPVPGR